jgi:hypothetical protein
MEIGQTSPVATRRQRCADNGLDIVPGIIPEGRDRVFPARASCGNGWPLFSANDDWMGVLDGLKLGFEFLDLVRLKFGSFDPFNHFR